ncbi:12-oxophytodienoate reductase [Dietzia psychralcaliphila]|uniref:12-oxophytodienoate reductase n=1 Tax=Dietzia psychralcaliphila TaxID=139021 RepID=A0AAD0JS84_9ACTN|nr:12-oxophytodienoate reductase [Dietzia psychralcaliphila]AWH96907.1 12-oxophytodienoate reductase [Dietzia psychralcaliphila]PTM89568.1 2,4-dienoyl-CoA reductase-like NADH-dependent reductase (Old Yellow Enzyme family) [Dietzia psychralcaliphila]
MTPSVTTTREALFRPLEVRSMQLANRLVMSPMTRMGCPDALPDEVNRDYYASRAAGGTGLIVTEGIGVDHPTSVDHAWIPRLDGPESVAAWRQVTDAVHSAGGRILAQLWHVGPLWGANARFDRANRDRLMGMHPMRPSGLWGTPGVTTYSERSIARWAPEVAPMTEGEIAEVIDAFSRSARLAMEAGFDGVTLHGGHGYLLDSFVWADTNRRTDAWGGDLAARSRFPAAVVAGVRAAIGADAPLFYRFSQHTQQDYTARKATTPDELGVYLGALAEAGVDLFDASTRRFDDPAFPDLEGDDGELSLAGWARRLTGLPTGAVGGVGIGASLREQKSGKPAHTADNIDAVVDCLEAGQFDLISVGRLHLADPAIATVLRTGAPLPEFVREVHEMPLRSPEG